MDDFDLFEIGLTADDIADMHREDEIDVDLSDYGPLELDFDLDEVNDKSVELKADKKEVNKNKNEKSQNDKQKEKTNQKKNNSKTQENNRKNNNKDKPKNKKHNQKKNNKNQQNENQTKQEKPKPQKNNKKNDTNKNKQTENKQKSNKIDTDAVKKGKASIYEQLIDNKDITNIDKEKPATDSKKDAALDLLGISPNNDSKKSGDENNKNEKAEKKDKKEEVELEKNGKSEEASNDDKLDITTEKLDVNKEKKEETLENSQKSDTIEGEKIITKEGKIATPNKIEQRLIAKELDVEKSKKQQQEGIIRDKEEPEEDEVRDIESDSDVSDKTLVEYNNMNELIDLKDLEKSRKINDMFVEEALEKRKHREKPPVESEGFANILLILEETLENIRLHKLSPATMYKRAIDGKLTIPDFIIHIISSILLGLGLVNLIFNYKLFGRPNGVVNILLVRKIRVVGIMMILSPMIKIGLLALFGTFFNLKRHNDRDKYKNSFKHIVLTSYSMIIFSVILSIMSTLNPEVSLMVLIPIALISINNLKNIMNLSGIFEIRGSLDIELILYITMYYFIMFNLIKYAYLY